MRPASFGTFWIVSPELFAMTQMMLFDSNSVATANPLAPPPLATVNPSSPASPSAVSPRLPSPTAGEDGVHRMGDLARLVLLRYQLVAQRREEMAARRAK
jgi:hypothetical protein